MAKTRHFGKITAFTTFDENHGFHDFRDYLLSLCIMCVLFGRQAIYIGCLACAVKPQSVICDFVVTSCQYVHAMYKCECTAWT